MQVYLACLHLIPKSLKLINLKAGTNLQMSILSLSLSLSHL